MPDKTKKALVVNNDSDTWEELVDTVKAAGFIAETVHCKDVTVESAQGYDVVILSGGWWYDDQIQHLEVYQNELELIRQSPVPIFGICLGMQLMQLAHSGHIALLDAPQQGVQPIAIEPPGQKLLGLPSSKMVSKNHTMGAITAAPGFEVLAQSPGHIEIICHQSKPLLGVQFHPELGDDKDRAIFMRQLIEGTVQLRTRPFMLPDSGPLKQPIAQAGPPLSGLLIQPKTALDEIWHRQLVTCNQYTAAIYNYLRPSTQRLSEQHAAFKTSGFAASPDLLPDAKYARAIQSEKHALEKLLRDVSRHEQNDLIRQAYTDRIQELISNAELYEAALDNDHQAYRQLNEAVYGAPDKAIFAAVCQQLQDTVEGWRRSYPAMQAYCDELLDLVPRQLGTTPVQLQPSDEVFAQQQSNHFKANGFYAQLFERAELLDEYVETEQGDRLVRQMLANLGAENFELQNAQDAYWGVSYHPGTIIRPTNYKMKREEFLAVVGHELGSHLLEWLNGDRQPLRLLGLGLAGYELGNEGRAVLREQIVWPTWQDFAKQRRWQDILLRHFIISLAAGVSGKGLNFSEIYKIVNLYDYIWSCVHGLADDAQTKELAQRQSWELISRALIGTDGSKGAYYKDIVYLEGNYACWQLAIQNPKIIRLGDFGKVNIASPAHLRILKLADKEAHSSI